MGKRIVIALGGNALGKNLPEQMAARSLSYRQLTPFDWKTLVARLK